MQEGEENFYLSKYLLSQNELTVVSDREFLLTKQIVIQKIHALLLETEAHLKPTVKKTAVHLLQNLLVKAGKVSKGENYKDLPYQVLDYPRHFTKESIFAYRTMFWWGNFFSCTLHIQGEILESYRRILVENLPKIDQEGVFFCVNQNPWEYHFDKNNYIPLKEIPPIELAHLIKSRNFIKFSRKLPIEQNKKLPSFALETFKLLVLPLL